MRLLIDENVSYRIIKKLKSDFPGSIHVSQIGKNRMMDLEIWEYAKKNQLVILTYDDDFCDLQVY